MALEELLARLSLAGFVVRTPGASQPPPFLWLRSAKPFIVAVVFCMAFTDIFLYGIIVPVVPQALVSRVGLAASEAQTWTSILLAVYGAGLLVMSPLFGYIADHCRSRQYLLVMGLFLLLGATVMLSIGTSLELWVVGRALQGASCAMVWTVGLALLADTVNEDELGKYLGIISLAMTSGTMIGPLLGGIVYNSGGYFSVFAMAFALIGLDIVLRVLMVEKKVAQRYVAHGDHELDVLASQPTVETEEARTDPTFAQTSPARRVPPIIWLLSSRRLLAALFATMVFGVMLTGFDAVLPLFVEETFSWSSTGSGLIFLAVFLPSVASPWIGHLVNKFGSRVPAAAGFMFTVPFYVLLRLVTHQSVSQEVLLCVLLALIGVGIALVSAPIFTEIVHIVYAKERHSPGTFGAGGATAQAYGLFNLAFAAGTIVGPIYTGFILNAGGWATMGWSLALLTGVTSVLVLLFTEGWVGNRRIGSRNVVARNEEPSNDGSGTKAA